MTNATLARVVRRETHSPRTVAFAIVATVLIIGLLLVLVEIVLDLFQVDPLVVAPGEMVAWLVALPSLSSAVLVAVGAVVALVGILLVIIALAPGRLAKQELDGDDRSVVVDNGVIASALAQQLSDDLGVERDRVVVGVSHRAVDVTLRPAMGDIVDKAEVRDSVSRRVQALGLRRNLKTGVRVLEAQEKGWDR